MPTKKKVGKPAGIKPRIKPHVKGCQCRDCIEARKSAKKSK